MATVTFDTLKFVEKLKAAGIPDAHAKAELEALQGALAESMDAQIATKADIARLERRMDGLDAKLDKLDARLSGDMALLKWMLALVVAAEAMPIVVKLFQ